jgi:hypothetical protein
MVLPVVSPENFPGAERRRNGDDVEKILELGAGE